MKNTDKSASGYQNRIVEKSSKTSHAAPHALRRNKSATACEIISNHRPGSDCNRCLKQDLKMTSYDNPELREGLEPKLSASVSSGFRKWLLKDCINSYSKSYSYFYVLKTV